MRKFKLILRNLLLSAGLFYCYSLPVFAITEAEVQAQVAAAGRETVTGNVFIWFLCAVAFLMFFRCKKKSYYAITVTAAVLIWVVFRFVLNVDF